MTMYLRGNTFSCVENDSNVIVFHSHVLSTDFIDIAIGSREDDISGLKNLRYFFKG